MTLIFRMSGLIDIDTIFPLLPIKRISPKEYNSSGKRVNVKNLKIPLVKPGSIISAKYVDQKRGLIVSNSRPFKNSISMYISTQMKYINMKISPHTIQITGAKSFANGREAVNHFVNHIYNIHNNLRNMSQNPEERDQVIEWILKKCRGFSFLKDIGDERKVISDRLELIDCDSEKIKKGLNLEFVKFLSSYIIDFKDPDYIENCSYQNDDYNTYKIFLNLLKLRDSCIIEHPYKIRKMDISTLNINYSLGFLVDRQKLYKLVNGREGFYAEYSNTIVNRCTILLPCPELPPNGTKNKKPVHSILVYRSGAVTQSSPHPALMKKAYEKFNKLVRRIKPMIEIHDPKAVHKLKYRPQKFLKPTPDLMLKKIDFTEQVSSNSIEKEKCCVEPDL